MLIIIDCSAVWCYRVLINSRRGDQMKVRTVLVVLMLLLAARAFAADSPRHDGNWFGPMTRDMKVAYLIGVRDGVIVSPPWFQMRLKEAGLDSCASSLDQVGSKAFSAMYDNISAGQLVDGLDALYADSRNRLI